MSANNPTPALSRWVEVRRWLATLARLGLAGMWLWAGISKIGDPAESLRAVRAYDVLPEWLAKAVAYGLPYVEITLAVFLLFGFATRLSAIVGGLLFVVFIAGIAQAAARGLQIECGCFGGGGQIESGQTQYAVELVRDSGLLILTALLAVWPASRFAADDALTRDAGLDPRAARVGPRRTQEARERLANLLANRERQRRRRLNMVGGIGLVVLIAVGGIGIGVQAQRGRLSGPIATPTGATGDRGQDGLAFGPADAEVTIDVYEDFQCPACKAWEAQSGTTIKSMYHDRGVRVVYHTLAFLNRASTTDYSSRSANAAACAADSKVFPAFHNQLFASQPEEGSDGLSNGELIQLGQDVGAIEDPFPSCVEDGEYGDWVDLVTDHASKQGVNATPTVRLNGDPLTESDGTPPSPETIIQAVADAQK